MRHFYLFHFYLVDHPATESFLYLLEREVQSACGEV